jgi:hypothetical protein
MKTMRKHPGFKSVANKAAARYRRKGVPAAQAKKWAYGGIANAARHASLRAKKANPNLRRVKG